jgi:hypothetical protein
MDLGPQQDNSLFLHFIRARNGEADEETLAARYNPADAEQDWLPNATGWCDQCVQSAKMAAAK